jgi:hypothetical protein
LLQVKELLQFSIPLQSVSLTSTLSIETLTLTAENDSIDGQCTVGCMAENGIGGFPSIDLDVGMHNYERCSDLSPEGSVRFGWCLQTALGIPVDFKVAGEWVKTSFIRVISYIAFSNHSTFSRYTIPDSNL